MQVKGNDKIPAPPVFVGESDISDGSPQVEVILAKYGLEFIFKNVWGFDDTNLNKDTGTFYEVEVVEFRNRSGKIVKEKRYTGLERLDEEWIKQGRPSEEAKAASRKDISYLREIASLGRQMKSM